jgi:hypothetical protein
MSTEPQPNPTPGSALDTGTGTDSIDEAYTHLNEVHALRRVLSRLEAMVEQTDDPVILLRLANAIARVSDSIVRALAAHHKLAGLAEKSKLEKEWAELDRARDEQRREEQQLRRDRAWYFRGEQVHWLNRLSEAAQAAAAADPTLAADFAASLKTYIHNDDFTYPPDDLLLAAMRSGSGSAWSTNYATSSA